VPESTGREPIRVVLGPDLVSLAKKYAVQGDFVREFAALAGSVYLTGGRSFYYLSRAMFSKRYDYPGANVSFVGVECDDKEKIWKLDLHVRAAELRRGYLYFAVAVSPVVKTSKGEMVSCLICGFLHHNTYRKDDLRLQFMQTSAPFPLIHRGITDEGKEVKWPDDLKRPWALAKNNRKSDQGSNRRANRA